MVKHFGQGRPYRYFCEDESRWGLKTLTGRVITATGVKPILPVQWQRDNFWLYGAVEPATGEHFFYSFSHLDSLCFHHFLAAFSEAFPDTLNWLQLDQASAHCAASIRWPDNVVPIFQPSHSPQLNPIERLWQDLRRLFQGRIFADLSLLQDALFAHLNSLTLPTVASLTGYPFILDSLGHHL